MRNNFWKWLKRFFIVLPIIILFIAIIFKMGEYWRENATSNYIFGDYDIIENFVINGFDNDIYNPLIFNYENLPNQDILYNINFAFKRLYVFVSGDGGYNDIYLTNSYAFILINFLTWWVFVELVFLFFRFVTFLISWVNSLFDNTFKNIKK